MSDFPDFREILQAMPCGCILFDDSGIIQFVNNTLCDLLDYKNEGLLNEKLNVIFTISSQIFYQTQLYPLIQLKGKADEIFLSLKTRQGVVLPVMLHGKIVSWNQKKVYIFIFSTVFERQKYDDELLRIKQEQQLTVQENEVLNALKTELQLQQQKLDQQVSMLRQRNQEYIQLNKVLTHDMQEPIRKIDIFTSILHGKMKDGKDELTLQKIHKSVARLRRLTISIQQFVDLDLADVSMTLINPASLIQEVAARVKTELAFDDFNLEINNLPSFTGRVAQMKILFMSFSRTQLKIEIQEIYWL